MMNMFRIRSCRKKLQRCTANRHTCQKAEGNLYLAGFLLPFLRAFFLPDILMQFYWLDAILVIATRYSNCMRVHTHVAAYDKEEWK